MPEFLMTREVALQADEADGELIPCTLSSETPVERGDYDEVLGHRPGEVDLSRAPLPLIVQHDRSTLNVGVVEQVRLEGGKLRGIARFGTSTQARQLLADVKSGIVRSLSVGYKLLEKINVSGRTVRFRWQPFEVSAVGVPADPNAGFYRSHPHNFSKGNIMETKDFTLEEHQTRSQKRNARDAIAEERQRVKAINVLATEYKMQEAGARAIEAGTSLDTFRQVVMATLKDTGTLRPTETPEIGLTEREKGRFSFRKAILALTDPEFARREAGFELEVSRAAAAQSGRVPNGILIPRDVLTYRDMDRALAQRDMFANVTTAGGYLVANELQAASFVDVMRQQSMVLALGATEMAGLVGNIQIPKKSGPASTFWVAEGSPVTESQMVLSQVPLTPKTVGGFSDFTRRLLLQATPDIEMLIRKDFADSIAVELDRVAITGGAANEPTGILNASGIGAVAIGTNGGAVTWDHVLQLEASLVTSHADVSKIAYLTTPALRRKLKGTTKVSADAGAGFIWENGRDPNFGTVNTYRAAASTNVPSDLTKGTGTALSAMILGDFSQVLIGYWGALDLYLDRSTGATSGTHRIVALLDCDVAIRQPGAFAAIKDAVTT